MLPQLNEAERFCDLEIHWMRCEAHLPKNIAQVYKGFSIPPSRVKSDLKNNFEISVKVSK